MAPRSEEPVVNVADGVVRSHQEGGLCWKLSKVKRDIELLPNNPFRVGKKGERKIAEV